MSDIVLFLNIIGSTDGEIERYKKLIELINLYLLMGCKIQVDFLGVVTMYVKKGRIKYGLKEFEEDTVKRFEKFLIYLGNDRQRTAQKYIYVLSKFNYAQLDIKTKDDIIRLHELMLEQDKETIRNIRAGKTKGGFQFYKNYNIVCYALRKWLIYKNKQELTLYLQKDKLKPTKRFIEEGHIKIKNKDINKILSSVDIYYEQKISSKIDEMKSEAEKKKKELTEDNIEKEIERMQNKQRYEHDRDKLLIQFLHSTGGRISETIQLETTDFNLEDLTFIVRKKISKAKQDKTKNFDALLSNLLKVYFQEHCKHNHKIFRFKHHKIDNMNENFKDTYQTMYSVSVVSTMMKKVERIAKMSKKTITSHKFRHLLGKTLREKGVAIDSIRDILGHSSVTSTEIYTHLGKQQSKDDYHRVKG